MPFSEIEPGVLNSTRCIGQGCALSPAPTKSCPGTVSTVKHADLIVVDGDPLTDITNLRRVSLVVANGKQYRPAVLWQSVGFEP